MRLNLALNGILVASTSLDPARYKDKYYMKAMRRLLCLQNQDILSLIPGKPVYYIEVPASYASRFFDEIELRKEPMTETEQVGEDWLNYQVCTNLARKASFSQN